MGKYVFITIIEAGLILALYWLIIGMVFSQSLELSDSVKSLTAFLLVFTI